MGKFVAARVLICPLLHGLEHIALNLNLIVACRRMMEGTEDVVNDLVNRDTSVFPCKENTTRFVSFQERLGRNGALTELCTGE